MKLQIFGGTRIASDFIIYGSINFLNKLISILIIFFLTKNLTVEDFGLVDFFISLISLGSTIVIFGQDSAIARFFTNRNTIYQKKKIITQSLLIYILNIFIIFPSLFIIFYIFYDNLIIKKNIYLIIFLTLSIFIYVFINFCLTILKYDFERKKYNTLIILQNFFILLSILILINFKILDYQNFIYFYFSSNLIVLLIGIYFIKKWIILINKPFLNLSYIKFATPIGLVAFLFNLSLIYERFFIYNNINLFSLGLYALLLKIAAIVQILIFTLFIGWEPYLYSNIKNKNLATNINLAFKCFVYFSFIICFFLNSIKVFVIILLSNINYIEVKYYVFPVIVGIIFQEIVRVPVSIISMLKKNYFLLIIQIFCFLFIIIFFQIIKNTASIEIIIYIVSFNYFLRFFLLTIIANKEFTMKLEILNIFMLISILLLLGYYLSEINIIFNNEIINFIFLLLISSLVLYFFLIPNEIKILKKILHKLIY
jgi:O-antigen/teichoic acid export membrane protein